MRFYKLTAMDGGTVPDPRGAVERAREWEGEQ